MKLERILFFVFVLLNISIVVAITGNVISEGSTPSSVIVGGITVLVNNFDGTTTNFTGLNNSQLADISGVILENTSFGKIEFQENLNLVASSTDSQVDFDNYVNISDNLIYIDNPSLPYLDKNVILSIYNLSYVNPQIIKGVSACGDCTLISYSGGTIRFSSTNFTGAYYISEGEYCGDGTCNNGETTSSCLADCPATPDDGGDDGGGGGGGGDTTTTNVTETPSILGGNFYVNPEFIALDLKKGSYYEQKIILVNDGLQDLSISVAVDELSKFIFPQERQISLAVGENYTLRLNVYISEARDADIYVGSIIFSAGDIERKVETVLNVIEKDALFDIRTEVFKKYVNPGGRVRANISIINMGDLRDFDVSLEYMIVDFNNNNYSLKKEDFAMDYTYRNVFFLDVPNDLPVGRYLFYSKVIYERDGVTASSYDSFIVENVSLIAWILVILILIVLVLFILFLIFRKKDEEEEKPSGFSSGRSLAIFPRRRLEVPKLD